MKEGSDMRFPSAVRKLLPLLLALALLCACNNTQYNPLNPFQNNGSSQSGSSEPQSSSVSFSSTAVPSAPLQLQAPTQYDLQIAVEAAVRADIDATPTMMLSLSELTTLYLAYSFENSQIQVYANPSNPSLILFYETDTENSVTRIYQYNLETSDFILLNQLGFACRNQLQPSFWAGNFFGYTAEISSSDEQIQLERAFCCFNANTNRWSFYPIGENDQVISTDNQTTLLLSYRPDGSMEIYSMDLSTMENTLLFVLSQRDQQPTYVGNCPDNTLVFRFSDNQSIRYARYTLDGTLLAECISDDPMPTEELLVYYLYQASPLSDSYDTPQRLTAFRLDDKDYVMPWRPVQGQFLFPTIYCKQELRAWNGLELLSREDGWSLWHPSYSVKGTPDFLLWEEETNFWQYLELDEESAGVTILRSEAISGNRLLLQVRQNDGNVVWKLMDLKDFYTEQPS